MSSWIDINVDDFNELSMNTGSRLQSQPAAFSGFCLCLHWNQVPSWISIFPVNKLVYTKVDKKYFFLCLQLYKCKPIPDIYRFYIGKLWLSSHNLAIENGRFTNISRWNRIFKYCHTNDIEDEMHFILICPVFQGWRKFLI